MKNCGANSVNVYCQILKRNVLVGSLTLARSKLTVPQFIVLLWTNSKLWINSVKPEFQITWWTLFKFIIVGKLR